DSERIAQLIELDRRLGVVQQDFRVTEEDPGYLLLDELRVDGRIDEFPDVVAGVRAVPVLDRAITRVKAGHHVGHPARVVADGELPERLDEADGVEALHVVRTRSPRGAVVRDRGIKR